jgi:hypothetical protein
VHSGRRRSPEPFAPARSPRRGVSTRMGIDEERPPVILPDPCCLFRDEVEPRARRRGALRALSSPVTVL